MPTLMLAVVLIAIAGCATTAPTAPVADGLAYRDDPHLQRVWVAEGFTFKGYEVFVVADTRTAVANVNPDGVENLKWATHLLRDEIVTAARATGLFATVTASAGNARPGARILRLENTIVEYEKGGGGARFFAGLYGAGQPVIRVRGRMSEGDRPVFAFEARRSGDKGLSRVFGGYRSDKAIQEEDIRDLAEDLVDFMARDGKR